MLCSDVCWEWKSDYLQRQDIKKSIWSREAIEAHTEKDREMIVLLMFVCSRESVGGGICQKEKKKTEVCK